MSYRNPQQVLDTQTGQAYRNLQASISNTFSKVADASIKEQAKLKKEQEARDKATALQAAQSKKDQSAIAEQSVKSNTEFQKIINGSMFALKKNGMNIVSNALDRRSELIVKGIQTTKDKIFSQNVEASYDAIKDGIVLWDSFISNGNTALGTNLGKPGGASLTGGEKGRAFMMILNDFKKGKVDFEPKFDNPDGVEVVYTATIEDKDDENYGKTYKMSYKELKDLQNGGGDMVPMIPDIYPSYKQSFNDANIVNDKKILQEDFLGAVGPSEIDPKNPKKTQRFRRVDEKKVKAALYSEAKTLVSSMGDSNPVGQFSLYNYYAEKQGIKQLPAGAILTTGEDSQTEDLTKMYVDDQYADLAGNFMPVLVSTGERLENEPIEIKTPELIESIFVDPGIVMAEAGIDLGSTYDKKNNTLKLSDTLDENGDIKKEGLFVDLNTLKGKLFLAQAVIVAKEGKTNKSRARIKSVQEEIKKRFEARAVPIPYRPGYVPDYMQGSDAENKARLMNKYFPNKK